MNPTRIDEGATQTGFGFVQHLFVRPIVLEQSLCAVVVLVASWSIAGDDRRIGLKVAVIEGAVGVDGQIDGDERHVSGRVEDIDVHDRAFNEKSLGVIVRHDGTPCTSIPVFILSGVSQFFRL